jgi:hypothetical protein
MIKNVYFDNGKRDLKEIEAFFKSCKLEQIFEVEIPLSRLEFYDNLFTQLMVPLAILKVYKMDNILPFKKRLIQKIELPLNDIILFDKNIFYDLPENIFYYDEFGIYSKFDIIRKLEKIKCLNKIEHS